MPNVRSHNEGTLFQRKRDSRWVAMVTMPDGRRRSASAASKSEGASLLRALLDQRDRAVRDPRRIRVGPFLREWVANVTGLAPSTLRQHEMIVRRHLAPALGGRLLTSLTPSDVDAYLARDDLDPQTRRHHRATMTSAVRSAVATNAYRGQRGGAKPAPLHQRLWSKTQVGPDCWEWLGAVNSDGYPALWDGTRLTYAYRIAYEMVIGPVAEGFEVDHTCGNRRCVNPAHLEAVTHQVNVARAFARRAARRAALAADKLGEAMA